jgi:hypothetical protein
VVDLLAQKDMETEEQQADLQLKKKKQLETASSQLASLCFVIQDDVTLQVCVLLFS